MAQISIRSLDSRNIVLEKEFKPFGTIRYEGFFHQSAQIITSNNQIFEFMRPSFWKDSFEIRQVNETFLICKTSLWGKVSIHNPKAGRTYSLSSKNWLNKVFVLTDDTGEELFTYNINYGFIRTIKNSDMLTTEKFDEMKEQFLICAAVILSIIEQIKKTVIISS